MTVVLGVDGGNTKTIALVASLSGAVLGVGRAGCGDIYGAPAVESAIGEIRSAVRIAFEQAGVGPDDIDFGVFSLAGADWPEDFALYRERLDALAPAGFLVVNDGLGPLRLGSLSGVGVALVCGTGPAAGARGRDGREWAASWWIQDATGAVGVGQAALRSVYLERLSAGPATKLTPELLRIFDFPDVDTMLHNLTRREHRSYDIGKAARVVSELAQAGDSIAQRLVAEHAEPFVELARVSAAQVGLLECSESFPVVLSGSVFAHAGSPMAQAVSAGLCARLPQSRPVTTELPPCAGAALEALARVRSDGMVAPIPSSTMDRMRETLPDGTFFET